MNKVEVSTRVLKNGKPLDLNLFSWDEKTNTFSSNEEGLVLDFGGIWSCTFKTGSGCTFKTGSGCIFDTGFGCTFNTDSDCTFDTSSGCTFKTGSNCTFKTGSNCTFKTGYSCTFNTGSNCTFKTDFDCTFNAGSGCTFNVRESGFFITSVVKNNVLILRNTETKKILDFEQFEKNKLIKFSIDEEPIVQNEEHEIIIDGKTIKISKESFEEFKKVLTKV